MAEKLTHSDELCNELDGDGVLIFNDGALHEFESLSNDNASLEDAETLDFSAAHSAGLTYLLERNSLVTDLQAHIHLLDCVSYHLWNARAKSEQ